VEGGVEQQLTRGLVVRGTVGTMRPSVGRSGDARLPTLSDRFSEADAPGQSSQPTFAVYRAGLLVDRRDAPNPRRGSLLDVDLRRLVDTATGAYSFTSTRIEAQHFVPFWNDTRVLAMRGVAERNVADAGAAVPFYLQPTIGGSRTLRGFQRQRFRDASMLLLQGEYRYEVNAFLMGAVFADAGQVAPSFSRMRWRDLSTDYGVGLRFGYASGVALRTDLAFGGEDLARLVVTFSAAF
jgi:outer membrane translocation and assembly module TamA